MDVGIRVCRVGFVVKYVFRDTRVYHTRVDTRGVGVGSEENENERGN